MWVGLGIIKDCGCSNLFWSFTKYRHHNTNANKFKKRKANLEEDLLAGGSKDCDCPGLDGYKVQKP